MDQALTDRLPSGFDPAAATWVRYQGSATFDYTIDYSIALVHADPAAGRVDYLVRWSPDAYCHYHRHRGTTVATVLDGEQHLLQTGPHETVTKVRTAGFSGPVPDGETHMERAGEQGLTMLFSTHTVDGCLFEMLDADGTVLAAPTIADFVERTEAEAAAAA